MKTLRRTPLGYCGTQSTSHQLQKILPHLMRGLTKQAEERPDLIMAGFAEVLGPELAQMANAVAFRDEVLFVKVQNSSLYQLLVQRDKFKILQALRKKFPKTKIADVVFRMR